MRNWSGVVAPRVKKKRGGMYPLCTLLTAVGAGMLAGGLAASGGHDVAGVVAGIGAFLLTSGLLAMRTQESEQKAESKQGN